MPQAQTFSSRQSEPTAQMTGEEKVWVAEGSLGLVRAVRATYFFARITAFFTGDAVGCQKTVMLFSQFLHIAGVSRSLLRRRRVQCREHICREGDERGAQVLELALAAVDDLL